LLLLHTFKCCSQDRHILDDVRDVAKAESQHCTGMQKHAPTHEELGKINVLSLVVRQYLGRHGVEHGDVIVLVGALTQAQSHQRSALQ
jgi:hypothetical protein